MELNNDDAARQSLLGNAEGVNINNTTDPTEDIALAEAGESGTSVEGDDGIGPRGGPEGQRRHARRSKSNRSATHTEKTDEAWEDFDSTFQTSGGGGSMAMEGEVKHNIMSIPHDSFSMLYFAEDLLQAMFPLSVFCLQMAIIALINWNFWQQGAPKANPLKIPVNVDLSVKISQCLACLVSVVAAEDFIQGIIYFGKSRTYCQSLPEDDTKISKKWELTNLMRTVEGVGVLVTSFIFIIQSDTAIDLWLNFAGVAFVGTLDDIAFVVAKNDILGPTQRAVADKVSEVEFHRRKAARGFGRKLRSIRKFLFVLVAAAMLTAWGMLEMHQANQVYACRSVMLTVSDSEHRQLRHFSGSYTRADNSPLIHGRAVYTQNQGRGHTILAYCNEERRWTVSSNQNTQNGPSPCDEFELMSEITKTYDIREVTHLVFRDDVDEAQHGVECIDCSKEVGCGRHGKCDEITRSCSHKDHPCDPGYFGYSCQYKGPCSEVRLPEENPMKKYGYYVPMKLLYHGNKTVTIFDRPVYYGFGINKKFGILAYDGGRWAFASGRKNSSKIADKPRERKNVAKNLEEEFSGNFSEFNITLDAVSEPTSSGSPAGIPFRAVVAKAQNSVGKLSDEEFYLDCADCNDGTSEIEYCLDRKAKPSAGMCKPKNDTNLGHGTINRCKCDQGFMGPLCKIRPIEGTATLHLDDGLEEKACTVCGSSLWFDRLNDGTSKSNCVLVPKLGKPLFFQERNIVRKFAVCLTNSHFRISVREMKNVAGKWIKKKTRKVYSVQRTSGRDRINIDFAVYLNQSNDFFGEVVDTESIDCNAVSLSGRPGCQKPLENVYRKANDLKQAWLHLDLKITPP